jgi:HEAT repeat protein
VRIEQLVIHPPRIIHLRALAASPKTQAFAARYARSNWDQRLTDPMIVLLRDPHLEIRQEASGCLSNHESTKRTSFYLGLLSNPDPNVRAHALGIAVWINRMKSSDEVSRAAMTMLKDPDALVQSAAVHALLRSRLPVPIPDLLPLLNHPYPSTVADVAYILRGGGRARYVGDPPQSFLPVTSADVAPLMTNSFGTVRLMGLRAMQDIADATAVELTLPLLRDTNSVIRSRAFSVVQEITGQNISDSAVAKWEAWWASNRGSFTPRKPAP